jgi:hypothetical protein
MGCLHEWWSFMLFLSCLVLFPSYVACALSFLVLWPSCVCGRTGFVSDSESLYGWQSVSQSVCLVEPTLWTFDQTLLPFQEFRSGICCPVSVRRPLWRDALSVLCKSQSSHLAVCTCTIYIFVFHTSTIYMYMYIYIYTGCRRRNVPDFRRVFLMVKYTDITQNTYVQSRTVT